ncbi:hypothetical protein ACTXT7_002211 [Hymenolepis weldensis]
MDGEGDYSDHEYYNIFLGIPESVHEALRCLQERQAAIRNTSNGESTNFTNSSEAHRQKTIESVLKLFTDTIPGDTWINFQHAAANLHRMHSLVKKRLNRVFKTSYDQGYINFSTNFPLPLDSLRPLLTASSDPPLGTVRRRERRQLITVKRRPRAVTCSSPLQFNVKVLPNPISHGEVGQNVYNKPEMPSATAIQMQPPLPSQSDDFCNCSSCSSSSSSSSATSSEVDF